MNSFFFGILKGLLYCLAYMPFWMLYGIADLVFIVLYYVVRYRRKLVRKNLTACFPDKSMREIKTIERQFYRNFADYIFETIKLMHISDADMKRRFRFENIEVVRQYMNQGRGVIAYFAHTFNWEWTPSITLHCREEIDTNHAVFAQIYRPLRNKEFDELMLKIRSRFGSESISKHVALRTILGFHRSGTPSITGFMSDQKPSHGDELYILNFLGRRTAVITGTETLARRLRMAVVYFDMTKERRGHYCLTIREMSNNAANTEPYQLTKQYFELLQNTIVRNPAIWLWSHNRWKNTPPENINN